MNYVLGLDLGIASVGWAVLNQDKNRIEDLGVRGFAAAENPKNKAPLAEPRRIARGARRRLQRRADRIEDIRKLVVSYGLVSSADLSCRSGVTEKPLPPLLFTQTQGKIALSPWQLRAEGLDRLLNGDEFARVLFHIAKRRGFKSNARTEKDVSEDGKVKKALAANQQLREEKGYRTIGEMFAKDETFEHHKRNQAGDYSHCVTRQELQDEIGALFASQRSLGNAFATPDFEGVYIAIWERQKPFSSGDDVLKKVGYCELVPTERRASKNSYSAELSMLLQKINHLSWYVGHKKFKPNEDQRRIIREHALKACEVEFKDLRKSLGLGPDDRFVGLTYSYRDDKVDPKCERTKFCNLSGRKEIRRLAKAAGLEIEVLANVELMDDFAYAVTFYKDEKDIRSYLEEKETHAALIEQAAGFSGFRGISHLSIKALRLIEPFLEQGYVYSDACEKAGFKHSDQYGDAPKSLKLPLFDPNEVRNPVVLRTLSQTRKVVNAVIAKYGSPTEIHVELGRELGKGPELRAEIDKRMKENQANNERLKGEFQETFSQEPRGDLLLKYKMYRDQNGQCAYSHTGLNLNRIAEPGYVEIEHVVPWSISYDNSLSNKVLALTSENRKKGNLTPFQYFGADQQRWALFTTWVGSNIKDRKKREKMLSEEIPDRDLDAWMPRNLIDTQYVARLFADHVRKNLLFANPNIKIPVVCVSGQMTSMLRGVWRLNKDRELNDLHHAADACVVAAINQRTIGLMTRFSHRKTEGKWIDGENYIDPETGEIVKYKYGFPLPWHGFNREIEARLSDDPIAQIGALVEAGKLQTYTDGLAESLQTIIVSRMPQRKVSGQMHKETIRSKREDEQGKPISAIKTLLVNLTKADLEKLYAPDTNEKLYEAIRERMDEFDYDAKKAFAEPLYKPTNDDRQGQVVRSVKVWDSQPSGIGVRGGIADNGEMVRVDVFAKEGKFYLVPVYSSQFLERSLPCRAIDAFKAESIWTLIDDSYVFQYQLYPYDLIEIIDSKSIRRFGYYRGCNRRLGSFTISEINKNDNFIENIGMRTAKSIKKYHVGILGDIDEIKQEKRHGLADDSDLESGEAED